MVSSVVSTLQVEDPTQSGIFNKGPLSRNQNYNLLDSQYTYVIHRPLVGLLANKCDDSRPLSARLPSATIRLPYIASSSSWIL